jgi:hypothetical protein
MKKFSSLVMTLVTVLLLAGCWNSEISSDMSITSTEGAGSKTVYLTILKDGQPKPDDETQVVENLPYLPAGYEGLKTYAAENAPEGFEVKVNETDTNLVFSITYSFDSIKEYNDLTKKLIGEDTYDAYGLLPATLETKDAEKDGVKGFDVTFTEDVNVLYASVAWAIEEIFNDPTLFNPDPFGTGAIEVADIYQLTSVKLTVGDTTTDIDLTSDDNVTLTEVSATGFIEDNGFPVVWAVVGGVVVALVIVGAIVYTKKRQAK